MDGIQTHAGAPHLAVHPSHPSPSPHGHVPSHPPAHGIAYSGLPAKGPADYLRAIRSRAWLVVAVAFLVTTAGAVVILRLPPVYAAIADVTIEPPRYDAMLSKILRADGLIKADLDENEKYVKNKVSMLRSKPLVDKVVHDPSLTGGRPIVANDDAAAELVKRLYTRNQPGTSYYTISLEGPDPKTVTRTLALLLEQFRVEAKDEGSSAIEESRLQAGRSIATIQREIDDLNGRIYRLSTESGAIGPEGTNLPREELEGVQQLLIMSRVRYNDLERTVRLEAGRPAPADPRRDAAESRLAKLEEELAMLDHRLNRVRRLARDWRDDPSTVEILAQKKKLQTQVERLRRSAGSVEAARVDDGEVILASARDEISGLEAESKRLVGEIRGSMPAMDQYRDLVYQRQLKQKQLAETVQSLSGFDHIAASRKDPVRIVAPPAEPERPVRPRRALYLAAVLALGLGLGVGLAGFLEHVDRSVKVPEHLTHGLGLPLLGVVPRIRRTGRAHRGGHIWTPGVPDSVEADSYRNIRASLLGVAGSSRRIVTLLVTSARAGEGKSTTSLNLAATCARAGERTLLVDIDLRRPSLAEVFPTDEGHLGLVDVLRAEAPWQRVVVPTDLPNLDFLPTGDPRKVPIEILGSLELRQLLLSLSQHHYDRVILDGPAILGLADCRTLGRIVDAALMVVRNGAGGLEPLRRAKAMLEQSRVTLAGVVFNGLADDLDNWSSYGPGDGQVVDFPALTRSSTLGLAG